MVAAVKLKMSDSEAADETVGCPQQVFIHRNTPRIKPSGEIVLKSESELNFRRFNSKWQSFYILSRLSEETVEYQKTRFCILLGIMPAGWSNRFISAKQTNP